MNQPSPAFQEAFEIISNDTMPADAESRLEQLETQIRPDEKDKFGDLWEAFIVASDLADLS